MPTTLLGRLGTLMMLAKALPLNRRPHNVSEFFHATNVSASEEHNLLSDSLLYSEYSCQFLGSELKSRGNPPTVADGSQGIKRRFGEIQAKEETTLETWIPHGIPGHISLVTSSNNTSLVDQLLPNIRTNTNYNPPLGYDPATAFISVPPRRPQGNETVYRIAEMGYGQGPHPKPGGASSTPPYHLYAKSLGQGTKFWILKSHNPKFLSDEGANGDHISGVGSTFGPRSRSSDGMEYPVTLRAPFLNQEYRGIYAYCVTYDPNPQGLTMGLSAAPCGGTTCVPEYLKMGNTMVFPMHAFQDWTSSSQSCGYNPAPSSHSNPRSSSQLAQTISRNPDGTVAPGILNIQPNNYLDSGCHATQVFLYDSVTGLIRPIYNPGGMGGHNKAPILPPGGIGMRPAPLWRGVVMRFEAGNR